jgi:phosphotransferase system enzyme I (PtsP)
MRTASGSRRLLGRLRDVMAGAGSAQDRLNRVVQIIAADMVSEVCSVYLRRAGDILELSATEGLFVEAVHRTRLRIGEGLIGVIAATARPLALSDAQSHKDFAYRPETGEESYQSLMGVPILRQNRVAGVLAVQNRVARQYTDEEVEVMETVAMVLAELTAAGEFVAPEELHAVGGIGTLPHRLQGVRLSPGLAIGTAVLHEPILLVQAVVADNPGQELERLELAIREMHGAIDQLLLRSEIVRDGEHRDVLETYRMFAEDHGWLSRIREAIAGGLTAEAAVQKVRGDTQARMRQVLDPYIRERIADLDDLANRLQRHLAHSGVAPAEISLPTDAIVVARSMGPADLLDYDGKNLRGLVLEEGSATAHVAIVARALDIPVVGALPDLMANVEPGDQVIVDGDNAQIVIRPTEDFLQTVENALLERSTRRAQYRSTRELPAITRDGTRVKVMMNAGLLMDLQSLDETGADGIGLYRTELAFMARGSFPTVDDQTQIYRRVLDHAGQRPVVFRTLDIGGDKLLPYMPHAQGDNPALGWRAIRIALDRPAMLRTQLRALIAAAAGRPLSVMFPMVTELSEFERARSILYLEFARARERGIAVSPATRVGVMLEVPALLFQLENLCRAADFISVGSNDLMQFLFAKDRGNQHVAERYDDLAPAALSCLASIIRAAAAASIPLSICGEMAGGVLEAISLIGLGFRTLSVAPGSVGAIKAAVRELDLPILHGYLNHHLGDRSSSLRSGLRQFARDHGVQL